MTALAGVGDVELATPVGSQKVPLLTINACYDIQELKRGR